MENKIIDPILIDVDDLLNNNYRIPLYQREYSWGKENIYKLRNSIKNEKTLYLGNFLIETDGNGENRIIDGQQRITTLLLILYYLDSKKYSGINEKIIIESKNENEKFNQLFKEKKETIIENIDKELKSVKEKKKKQKENDLREKNIYKLNFYYISQFFGEIKNKEELLKHILKDIKIVKITINANKDKNLDMSEIFDTLNTTGKPLGTKDKFKVRIYNLNNNDKTSNGEKIENIYATINECNNAMRELEEKEKENLFEKYFPKARGKVDDYVKYDSERYDVDYFLRLYQFFLIINILKNKKNNDNYTINQLMRMDFSTFFDGLFDILYEKTEENNKEVYEKNNTEIENITEDSIDEDEDENNENELDLLDNRKIFKAFYQNIVNITEIEELFKLLKEYKKYISKKSNWEKDIDAYFSYKLFKNYNRYSWTYGYLLILYYYVYKENPNFSSNFHEFIKYISKLCILYSIIYSKSVYECRNFLLEQVKEIILNKPIEDYIKQFKQRVNDVIKKYSQDLNDILSKDITETNYKKNIICLILAKEAEMNSAKDVDEKYDRINKLFSINFDIEHIYALGNNKDNNKLEANEENGIGNLMILEYSYNRSIGKISISKKIKTYLKSNFEIVKKFAEDFKSDEHFIQDIKNKKDKNSRIEVCINKIKEYFFE